MPLLPLALLVLGCRTSLPLDFTDQWTETQEICDWEGYREEWTDDLVGPADRYLEYRDLPAYPSKECVDQVLDDFGVNVPAMLAADERDDPYLLLYPGERDVGRTQKVLLAARGMFLYDFGQTRQVRPSWLVSRSTTQWLDLIGEITGQQSVNAAMFNLLTTAIETVEPLEDDGALARMDTERGALLLSNGFNTAYGSAYVSSVLAHEASHSIFDTHVNCVSAYTQAWGCDPDMERAHGTGITWRVLAARWYEESESLDKDLVAGSIWNSMNYINDFQDEDGQPLPEIREFRSELEP